LFKPFLGLSPIGALYQRSKGRDLFDLWHVLAELDLDDARVIAAFNHYMGDEALSYRDLVVNLKDKLQDPSFRADLTDLVIDPPADSQLEEAADLVMGRLGARHTKAPSLDLIENGRWRQ